MMRIHMFALAPERGSPVTFRYTVGGNAQSRGICFDVRLQDEAQGKEVK